jgi:uncharacterized protein YacL
MIKNLIRSGITILGFLLGVGVFSLMKYISGTSGDGFLSGFTGTMLNVFTIVSGVIFAILLFLLFPALAKLSSRVAGGIEQEIRSLSAHELAAGVSGLVVGLVIAFLISSPIVSLIPNTNTYVGVAATIIIYIVFIWLGVVIGMRKGKDVIVTLARIREDYESGRSGQDRAERVSKTPSRASNNATPKILDTSVIIDGRVADIMKAGFLEGRIIIPDFVLVELRHIADSSDNLRRVRGRRGLDVLNRIQQDFGIEIYATSGDKALDEIPEVDVKLLKLGKTLKAKVVTNDFNLNKVAAIQGVGVLNINELAGHLKPVVLPGEELQLFLVKEGKEHGQAVGYFDDGTMIVVEDGKPMIGQTVAVNVTSVLQTAAGRMIFARLT